MPKLVMFVGVPGSGKSFAARKMMHNDVAAAFRSGSDRPSQTYLSTDQFIEEIARDYDLEYGDIFKDLMPVAVKVMERNLELAIQSDEDIYWDQTNTTRKGREKKLRQVPAHYEKVCVVIPTPDNVRERLDRREQEDGKHIPEHVLESMLARWEEPSLAEGWDRIVTIDSEANPNTTNYPVIVSELVKES